MTDSRLITSVRNLRDVAIAFLPKFVAGPGDSKAPASAASVTAVQTRSRLSKSSNGTNPKHKRARFTCRICRNDAIVRVLERLKIHLGGGTYADFKSAFASAAPHESKVLEGQTSTSLEYEDQNV